MAIRRKTPKPDPHTMYRALDSYVYRGADGQDESVKADTRLLGSHRAVQAHPELWAQDGLDDEEMYMLRKTLMTRSTGGAA